MSQPNVYESTDTNIAKYILGLSENFGTRKAEIVHYYDYRKEDEMPSGSSSKTHLSFTIEESGNVHYAITVKYPKESIFSGLSEDDREEEFEALLDDLEFYSQLYAFNRPAEA